MHWNPHWAPWPLTPRPLSSYRLNWRVVKNAQRWIRWWLIAAAVLAVGLLASLWAARAVHEYRVDRRVAQHRPLIERYAAASDLSPALVTSVVRAESSGDPHAVSHASARGLMQITPDTHTEVKRRFDIPDGNLFDPAYNLRVGTTYLSYLFDRFGGDRHLALAAYHMGPTRVARILRENPGITGAQLVKRFANPTTRAYVGTVLEHADPAE